MKKKFNLRLEDTGIHFSSHTNNLIVNKMKYYKYPLDNLVENLPYCRYYYKEINYYLIDRIASVAM